MRLKNLKCLSTLKPSCHNLLCFCKVSTTSSLNSFANVYSMFRCFVTFKFLYILLRYCFFFSAIDTSFLAPYHVYIFITDLTDISIRLRTQSETSKRDDRFILTCHCTIKVVSGPFTFGKCPLKLAVRYTNIFGTYYSILYLAMPCWSSLSSY